MLFYNYSENIKFKKSKQFAGENLNSIKCVRMSYSIKSKYVVDKIFVANDDNGYIELDRGKDKY